MDFEHILDKLSIFLVSYKNIEMIKTNLIKMEFILIDFVVTMKNPTMILDQNLIKNWF